MAVPRAAEPPECRHFAGRLGRHDDAVRTGFQHAHHDFGFAQARYERHHFRTPAGTCGKHDLEGDLCRVFELNDGQEPGAHCGTSLVQAFLVANVDQNADLLTTPHAGGGQLQTAAVASVHVHVRLGIGLTASVAELLDGDPLDSRTVFADSFLRPGIENSGLDFVLDRCVDDGIQLSGLAVPQIYPRRRHRILLVRLVALCEKADLQERAWSTAWSRTCRAGCAGLAAAAI